MNNAKPIDVRTYGHRLWRSIARLEWSALCLLVLTHMATTYAGLQIFGEEHLKSSVTFSYFYFTTASTIGYGDISPLTDGGRTFAFLWLFPGALTFYMVLLAKVTQLTTSAWRRRMDGYGNFAKDKKRTVIIGYMPDATQRVIRDLMAAGLPARDITLMATRKPGFNHEDIDFVLSEDLARSSDLIRAGVKGAKNILIMGPTDDATFTAAMAAFHIADDAHMVAAVECETRADLLTTHTSVVPVVSQSPEVVASEVLDPGVGQLLSVLGAASRDVTAYSIKADVGDLTAGVAHAVFRQLGMTFLGFQCSEGGLKLNPDDDSILTGLHLYYIAAERVDKNDLRGAIVNQSNLQNFKLS